MMSRLYGTDRSQGGLSALSSKVYVVAWIMMCSCRASKGGLKPVSVCFGFAVALWRAE